MAYRGSTSFGTLLVWSWSFSAPRHSNAYRASSLIIKSIGSSASNSASVLSLAGSKASGHPRLSGSRPTGRSLLCISQPFYSTSSHYHWVERLRLALCFTQAVLPSHDAQRFSDVIWLSCICPSPYIAIFTIPRLLPAFSITASELPSPGGKRVPLAFAGMQLQAQAGSHPHVDNIGTIHTDVRFSN